MGAGIQVLDYRKYLSNRYFASLNWDGTYMQENVCCFYHHKERNSGHLTLKRKKMKFRSQDI